MRRREQMNVYNVSSWCAYCSLFFWQVHSLRDGVEFLLFLLDAALGGVEVGFIVFLFFVLPLAALLGFLRLLGRFSKSSSSVEEEQYSTLLI